MPGRDRWRNKKEEKERGRVEASERLSVRRNRTEDRQRGERNVGDKKKKDFAVCT